MNDFYNDVLESPFLPVLAMLAGVVYLLLCTVGIYIVYFFLSLPLRRAERARVFLDLLQLGVEEGISAGQIITQTAAISDKTLGRRFQQLAREMSSGKNLGTALAAVPRLLPQQVVAMLAIGERLGDVRKVIPAARKLQDDALSQVRGALNYLLIITFAFTPVMIFLPIFCQIKVIPVFRAVFEDMLANGTLPAFTRFVLGSQMQFVGVQMGFLALVWAMALCYAGGPRLGRWLRGISPEVVDGIFWMMPWRRKRLQRDFSAMLAVLLDAGIAEAAAVTLAGQSTHNVMFEKRAGRVCDQLRAGVALPEAIQSIDGAGELRWRLANALKGGSDFQSILAGWHDALDASAFQQEQAAAQVATTVLVLYNGLVVGMTAIAIFLALIALIQTASLW